MTLERIEGVGQAHIFRGDPRLPTEDIDLWLKGNLTVVVEPRKRDTLWGSDAGHCVRKNVLLAHNEWIAEDISPTTNLYMTLGIAAEDMLANGLAKNGVLVGQSVPLPLGRRPRVSGRIDLVVFDHEDELALIEVKTCGKLPTEPKVTHLAQIQMYAALTGIDRAWLTYISRNVELVWGEGLSIRTFQVDVGENSLVHRIKTALLSEALIRAGKLPPKPGTFRKHTECHFCPFRDLYCWDGRVGRVTTPASPPLPEVSGVPLAMLENKAFDRAKAIYLDRPDRRREFIHYLLHEYPRRKGVEYTERVRAKLEAA